MAKPEATAIARTERPLPETAEDAAAPDTTRLKRKVAKHSTATALHSSKLRASMDIGAFLSINSALFSFKADIRNAPLQLKIYLPSLVCRPLNSSSITERRKLSRIRVVREKVIKYRETQGSTKNEQVLDNDVAGMATRSRVTSRSSDETSGSQTVRAPPSVHQRNAPTILPLFRCICTSVHFYALRVLTLCTGVQGPPWRGCV